MQQTLQHMNIQQVLQNFLGTDHHTRQIARQWLESSSHELILISLIDALQTCGDDELRGLAAVLLRSRLRSSIQSSPDEIIVNNIVHDNRTTDTSDTAASETTDFQTNDKDRLKYISVTFIQTNVAQNVLQCFAYEKNILVRHRLAGAIALIAAIFSKEEIQWPELWTFLSDWLGKRNNTDPNNAEDISKRLGALVLLSSLAENHSTLLLLETHGEMFIQSLIASLHLESTFEEKKAALLLVAAIDEGIFSINAESQLIAKIGKSKTKSKQQFGVLKTLLRNLVPKILNIIEEIVNNYLNNCFQGEDELNQLFDIISQITDADPSFWFDCLNQLFSPLKKIILSNQTNTKSRQHALRMLFRSSASYIRVSTIQHTSQKMSQQGSHTPGNELQLIDNLLSIIREIIHQTSNFNETDTEWMMQPEESPLLNADSDSIVDMLVILFGEFIHSSGSDNISLCMMNFAIQLFSEPSAQCQQTAIVQVYGLRFLSQIIEERQTVLENSAADIIQSLFELLSRGVLDMRTRWWMLTIISDLLTRFGPDLQRRYPGELLTVLSRIVREDPVPRCQYRALAALYSFFALLEEDEEMITPFLDPVLISIVVPAIQTDNEEMQELGLSVASVIAGVSGKKFDKYYDSFMGAVKNILNTAFLARNNGLDTSKHFFLCEAAISLAAKLTTAKTSVDKDSEDFAFLTDHMLSILEALLEAPMNSDEGFLSLLTVTEAIAAMTTVMGNNFSPYIDRLASVLFRILQQSDAAEISGPTDAPALQNISSKLLGNLAKGKLECVEEGGVTQVHVKGCDGEDQIFEFKTRVIEEKVAALECLANVMTALNKLWIPYIEQTLSIVIREADSRYVLLRRPSLHALTCILPCFLPEPSEDYLPLASSQCPLATGNISGWQLFVLVKTIFTSLLPLTNLYSTARAAEILPALESVLDSYKEAVSICNYPNDSQVADFVSFVFTELGKRMVLTLATDIENMQLGAETAQTSIEETNHSNESNWEEDTSTCSEGDEHDPEGVVYSSITHCISNLFKIFKEKCTELFGIHLQTPYTGLLTLPEANMSGRVAALYGSGIFMEFGAIEASQKFAADILPTVLLYARCNEVSQLEDPEAADDDVERVQAACYCIGVVSQVAPTVFLQHFESSIRTLKEILRNPHSLSENRLPAAECSFGAFIKLFMNPIYREQLLSIGLTNHFFVELMKTWFPISQDEDESRTITDLLINSILKESMPAVFSDSTVQSEVLRGFHSLKNQIQERPCLIEKETRRSKKIDLVIQKLSLKH